ncbi:retrovirus-related pol polyprotein from transposon TNT 1-94 [Tanacetum coccineum]|uniref:Retrovirus-related pol polyprotein from transposon TNT 1-94 n=1 Tax=Tanacetum coccineum TaxID=301880 RepID=A0ABQ5IAD8_9ASTR
MHNNIMAAGSKDHPPMLGPGRYSQWRSRFLRYIDTKPNGEGLRKSILSGPYVPSTVLVQAVAATEGVPAVQQHTTIETVLNMTPENKEHFLSEKEAIFLLLTGIGDDIYSTVDACKTANEMWIAIERLQQGESLNVQDVKTNLPTFANPRYLKKAQSEKPCLYKIPYDTSDLANRFAPNREETMTLANKSRSKLNKDYVKPYDYTKQNSLYEIFKAPSLEYLYQLERAKEVRKTMWRKPFVRTKPNIAKNVAFLPVSEIAKPVTPQSESVSKEDSDPEQAQRDKGYAKEYCALLAKYFKGFTKATKQQNPNFLQTSGTLTEIPHQGKQTTSASGQFGNQRTMTVAGTRETVGSPVVQQTGIQCFNCKGFGHYAKECRKPKRVKDYSYHKEKMMMCKKAEQGKNNNENNVFANERQHSENNTIECVDERTALANLIANLTLDTEENKMILKQLKKANASLTQQLEECKTNLDKTSKALGEATSCRDSYLIALQNKHNELEKYIAFNDQTIDYEILQTKLNDTLGLLALKDIEIKEGLKTKAYEISILNQKHNELVKKDLLTEITLKCLSQEQTKLISRFKVNSTIHMLDIQLPRPIIVRPTFANPMYLKKLKLKSLLYEIPIDTSRSSKTDLPPNRKDHDSAMRLDQN